MSYLDMEHAYNFLWSILYLRKTIILCYEVPERNAIIETTAAHFFKKVRWLRGCSYGGELAQLGGLARLGEISPFLRNSYKYVFIWEVSQPA